METVPTKPLTIEEFNALTKPQQRILVARDVLEQLKIGKYQAKRTYFSVAWIKDSKADLRTNFDNLGTCNVCGLGACMLSLTRFKNQLTVEDALSSGVKPMTLLRTVFTRKQLALIEYAYEMGSPGQWTHKSINRFTNFLSLWMSKRFGERHGEGDANARMVAIMRNIVNNNGTFVPLMFN